MKKGKHHTNNKARVTYKLIYFYRVFLYYLLSWGISSGAHQTALLAAQQEAKKIYFLERDQIAGGKTQMGTIYLLRDKN